MKSLLLRHSSSSGRAVCPANEGIETRVLQPFRSVSGPCRAVCPANEGIETQHEKARENNCDRVVARSAPLMRGLKRLGNTASALRDVSRGLPR